MNGAWRCNYLLDFSIPHPGRAAGIRAALLCTVLAAWIIASGCAITLPRVYESTPSMAYANPQDTVLGQFFESDLAAHSGKSGVTLVTSGAGGFTTRAGLSALAEKTLDVQYYIWEVDNTGKILAERILRAADRGVRVRMLLDDINTADSDFKFARMDFHPNIEVRLFNPFANRRFRTLNFLANISRLNHRMHNKAFIVDNAIAVVGGRNIGDDYFGVDTVSNFRDLDLLVVGPVVKDISYSFDKFWNSEWAIPASAIIKEKLSAGEFETRKGQLYQWVENFKGFPYPVAETRNVWFDKLDKLRGDFIWAPVEALYDDPFKVETDEKEVMTQLRLETEDKEHEVVFEAAYLIVGDEGVEGARSMTEKGIRVRILTNSLATNDVAAAHAGYAKYRKGLIRNGVELYEFRPDASFPKRNWSLLAGSSKASLHTKAIVVDREKVFIGSFNFDPRSQSINTEIVIFVESTELAAQVLAFMYTGLRPENSYRLALEQNEQGKDRLVWITEDNGREVRYYSDPEVGLWRRFSTWLISLLPIEEHL